MQCLFNTVNYIIKNVIVSFFYKSTTSNIKYHLIPHVVITIDFMQLLDTPSSLSEGYRSTVFPLHSWSCQLFFPSTFISWILSIKYFLHNDIIFNKSAQDTKFTYVKICTQLIQNTKCVPKILLCVFFLFFVCFCLVIFCWFFLVCLFVFFAIAHCKTDTCSFHIHNFLQNTSFVKRILACSADIYGSIHFKLLSCDHENQVNAAMGEK